ncbi:DUF4395 domain-containing protein [Geothrix sp. PMB-07]|uniref:DUF4395 domain-containing protein n=1 Tax=Geothrix sp. PMB-07 TaxID=3068640 RepID=UPI0027408DFB|nr:DUF4395 domain-containing protein [Geothrix sp. PMB-07]WLT32704.1 DUF4395 domain-containing protein [Geothrix sp. PMB-07]
MSAPLSSRPPLEAAMPENCPISPDLVDERATRIGAGLVLAIALSGLWLGRWWIPLLLAADFALRSRGWTTFSLIAQVAKALRAAVGWAPQPINAGPKRFAALLGALFSLGFALALWRQHGTTALVIASLLLLCAALEAFFGYCVGCKAHSLLQSLLARKDAAHAAD